MEKLKRKRPPPRERRIHCDRSIASFQRNRGVLANIRETTGIYEDDFEEIFRATRHKIVKPRGKYTHRESIRKEVSTSLRPRCRLLLFLQYLRERPGYRLLGERWSISRTQVSRELRHLLPILYCHLTSRNIIIFPPLMTPSTFHQVVGAIDCSSHFRNRVHPRQADYYRGDKHAFFITAQVVCSLQGVLYSVCLGLGHNNDQGMLHITGMTEKLSQLGIYLLADGGYSHPRLICPDSFQTKDWNNTQKKLRSIVERVFGLVKRWEFANLTVFQSPEFQQYSLMTIYNLVQIRLLQHPLASQ